MKVITKNNEYYYDNNTGLIFPCSDILLDILSIPEWESKSKKEVNVLLSDKYDFEKVNFYYEWIVKYTNFLKKNLINNYSLDYDDDSIEVYLLKYGFKQLILSVTEDCNFRCSYCVYSDEFLSNRNHSHNYMNFDTAIKAINIYLKYIEKGKNYNLFRKPSFSFYGGEPLLNFNLIKKIVYYIWDYYGKDVNFNITTNGSYLTHDIADWLMEHDFLISISMDGNREEHNRKRKDKNGNPTFFNVFNNVKYILNKNYSNLYVLPVFDWQTDFLECDEFFNQNFLKVLAVSQVDNLSTKQYYDYFNKLDYSIYQNRLIKIKNNYIPSNNIYSYLYHIVEEPFIKFIFESFLLSVFRPFTKFTASCVPGEKLFVNVHGEFHMCERIPEIFPIGNVNSGLNFDGIVNLINEFNKKLDLCAHCKVSKICQKCYKHFMEDDDFQLASNFCHNSEKNIKVFLEQLMCFMEKHQDIIEKNNIRYNKWYNWRD